MSDDRHENRMYSQQQQDPQVSKQWEQQKEMTKRRAQETSKAKKAPSGKTSTEPEPDEPLNRRT